MTRCDVCNRCLSNSNGVNLIAFSIELSDTTEPKHKETIKTLKEFGKLKFDICFSCFLTNLGVKKLNGNNNRNR